MSLQSVMARIDQIQTQLDPGPAPATTSTTSPATPTATDPTTSQFASMLSAQGLSPTASTASTASLMPATTTAAGGSPGQAIVAAAESQVGVTEQPPGSNDSPQIAAYRTATAGSGVGPWCAYFASWAAKQAGEPLGEQGQGFGSVSAVYSWAQRTGRAEPASYRPNPGDLIVWGGEHIGIVESVDANGTIHTIEGNSSNAVSRRTYGPDGGGATGYVRMS